MLEAALLCVVIKHIVLYYVHNERFRESVWDKQMGLSLLGVLVIGLMAILFPTSEYPQRRHDFSGSAFFMSSYLVEYLMVSWLGPIRRSVGTVIMNTHGFRMHRSLLRSRTFIAVFSIYLIIMITMYVVIDQYRGQFLYP